MRLSDTTSAAEVLWGPAFLLVWQLLVAAGFAAGRSPAVRLHTGGSDRLAGAGLLHSVSRLATADNAGQCRSRKKWVCLTFDDGPSRTTPAVLTALDAAGVHGTFFVVATGYNEKYLPLLTQAAAAGHQIALHSASHEYSDIYDSSEAYWADIALLKERIAPYVDAESIRYLRFPGGSTNTVSRRYGGREADETAEVRSGAEGLAVGGLERLRRGRRGRPPQCGHHLPQCSAGDR